MCRLIVDVGVENNRQIAFVRGLDSISLSVLSDKYFNSSWMWVNQYLLQ